MDILLAIVPRIQDDFGYTPAGPSLLKGSLVAAGFSAKIIDFNAKLEEELKDSQSDLIAVGNYFMTNSFYNANVSGKALYFIDKWAREIVSNNPTWLGISVFSYNSQRAARLLSVRVKQLNSKIKIVIGGGGITTDFSFVEGLYEDKIIDAYIRGEGENALIELLKGNNEYFGINGTPGVQIDDLDRIPFPDFADYELQTYTNRKGLIALPITGSRGCVRSCTFCDVDSQWPKYRFRSGKNIANEIKFQVEKYGVTGFRFTDSLINGSLKAFRDMIYELADFRDSLPDHKKFTWDSHFIVRSPKEMPPEIFDVMKRAGAGVMLTGIESGSQEVRDHMKKGFTQEQLDYCMEQFSRVGIKVRMLMVVGYPTETADDFKETLDLFDKYLPYCKDGTVDEVNLGLTLNLLINTPLYNNKDAYGIIQEENHINNWICVSNPTLDYKERLRRRIILQEHIESLGYKVFENKNYTKQLFLAWSEVSKLSKPKIVKDFKYDRDSGGIKENSNSNKSILNIVSI